MTRYTAELSKSNRSSCKKCKEKIEKDVIRIGTHVTNADDITMVSWCHLGCFVLPKKIDFRDFLEDLEVDGLTPVQCAEVCIWVSFLSPRPPPYITVEHRCSGYECSNGWERTNQVSFW